MARKIPLCKSVRLGEDTSALGCCEMGLMVSISQAGSAEERSGVHSEPSVSGGEGPAGTFLLGRPLSGTLGINLRGKVEHRGVSGVIASCRSQGMAPDDLEN